MPRIISNHRVRPMFQLCELDSQTQARLRAEFDWIDDSKTEMFFRYRGEWYCMSQFARLEGDLLAKGWQGYLGETAWSSTIIKIVNSCNDVIIGRCISD